MLPALLGLMAPVAAVRALTQLARAAGAALRSATARVALPVPTNAEKAAEGFSDNSDSPVIFGYDGYGRRIKIAEFDNGNLTSKKLYWWLGGQIVCERDGITPGFPITKRYFGQGVVVGGERLYYTMDQLGSVRELVDSSGVVRSDYRYSTYGERTKEAGDLDSDFGYGGLFHHAPSGLDLATYRTYDSTAGRWISRDPLGEGVDYNLYRYCGNNPISCVDPSGLILIVSGSSDAINAFKRDLKRLTGREAKVTNGRVSLSCSKSSEGSDLAGSLLDAIIKSNKITRLDLFHGDLPSLVLGVRADKSSTGHQQIDMQDVDIFESHSKGFGLRSLVHEIVEASMLAGGVSFDVAHENSISVENMVARQLGSALGDRVSVGGSGNNTPTPYSIQYGYTNGSVIQVFGSRQSTGFFLR
jgi:RHS repeat-associated protein